MNVAIIGAGFSGLGAAYALRDRGLSAAVLEARTIASGASGRNAGFVLAGPAMSHPQAVTSLGPDATRELWALTEANSHTIAGLVEDLSIACGYLRRGSMSLAQDENEWEELRRCEASLRDAGISACLVARDSLPRPLDRLYSGGLYYGGNAEIDPGAFLRSIASYLSAQIEIYEWTPVQDIQRDGAWRLETPHGSVRAERVIVCANAYTVALLPDLPIEPKRGQVLATAPLERVYMPFPMYANHGYQYWRQTANGRLVVGGWRDMDLPGEVGIEEQLHPGIQDRLQEFTRELLGTEPAIEYQWAGIMGFTPDLLPLVGEVPGASDMWLAAGYCGHGVSMAFTCGARVAARALGSPDTIPSVLHPARMLNRSRGATRLGM